MALNTKIAAAKQQIREKITPRFVTVPQPPPISLTPKHSQALVTVSVGKHARDCLKITAPYMRDYAKRLNLDFVVLNWPGHPDWPMSCKFGIPRVFDYYERIAYVDADVLLRPGCVNLFDSCLPHEFGMVDELVWHQHYTDHKRIELYKRLRSVMEFPHVDHLPWMMNCGIMVVPQSHQSLLFPPQKPILVDPVAEQDHTNAMLLASGLPYRMLDRRCNWQWWSDQGFCHAPPDAILHWSGCPDRIPPMREFADKHPSESITFSQVKGPDWFNYTSLFDVQVEVASQNAVFVEVGCWYGRSTLYLAHTIQESGKSIKLYGVDTWAGTPNDPEQHGNYGPLIERNGDPFDIFQKNMKAGCAEELVTPIRMPSVEAAKQFDDESVDFCFIDADHTEKAVREDITVWLPKVRPGGLLAGHDYHLPGVRAAVDDMLPGRGITGTGGFPCWLYRKGAV